jgi:RimJ/RimL family protein N-acetyltransferase
MNPESVVAERNAPARDLRLPGGESITVRAIRPQDAGDLQAYMRNLSAATRRSRFLGAVSELAASQLDRLTHMDGPHELALLAFAEAGGETQMIGEAILVMAPNSIRCEIALSVTDDWQGRGLGLLLMRELECRARSLGARYLIGDVLRTNEAMKGLARKAGFAVNGRIRDARLIEIVKDLSVPQSIAA